MNPREFFMGTKQERIARSVVEDLKQQAGPNGVLPRKDQKKLEANSVLAKRVTRRRLLAGVGAVAGSALTGGLSWLATQGEPNVAQQDAVDNFTPTVIQEPEITTIEQWNSFSSFDRLQMLFRNKSPEIEGFDPVQETVKATAQFYTENVPSNLTAEEMIESTNLVTNPEEFVDLGIRYGNVRSSTGLPLSDEGRKFFYENTMAITSPANIKERVVVVNLQGFIDEIQRVKEDPWAVEYSKDHNMLLENIHSVLTHEYGHMNNNSSKEQLPDIKFLFDSGVVKFNVSDELRIYSDKEDITIPFDEAVIEYQALELCNRAQNEVVTVSNNRFRDPASWIEQLNVLAGISETEMSEYLIGKRPVGDMFYKWGSLNTEAARTESHEDTLRRGFRIGGLLGLVAGGMIDSAEGILELNSELTVTTRTFELTPHPVATP